jgi:dihydrofolate reductase
MEISLIAAKGKYNEIGYENKLLWHIKEDFKWFQRHTMNKPVIMGRSTYESIGKPLKHRINVVISNNKNYNPDPSVLVLHSIEEVMYEFRKYKEIMVIGGQSIYNQFMPLADRLYLTEIDKGFVADTFFPDFPEDDYKELYNEKGTEDVGFDYYFKVYRKKLK